MVIAWRASPTERKILDKFLNIRGWDYRDEKIRTFEMYSKRELFIKIALELALKQ